DLESGLEARPDEVSCLHAEVEAAVPLESPHANHMGFRPQAYGDSRQPHMGIHVLLQASRAVNEPALSHPCRLPKASPARSACDCLPPVLPTAPCPATAEARDWR